MMAKAAEDILTVQLWWRTQWFLEDKSNKMKSNEIEALRTVNLPLPYTAVAPVLFLGTVCSLCVYDGMTHWWESPQELRTAYKFIFEFHGGQLPSIADFDSFFQDPIRICG
mmetsp:Transcript_21128/g.48938  ORF Transcript_21128/g.48938 Transcript_21128/m.48938 type:complete len:111 (+) Transcript_21128:513-845(+)